ncbi:MAG TPA: glucosamine-6-phosphate deaminase [Sphingobacteriaceae bacterium]|nr:glucosamine-6-phosphate deaminase [Sphingobacteriaceae bacterium]
MKIFIADTYRDMSEQAAGELISLVQTLKSPVICPASGDTPAGLYKELVELIRQKNISISDWHFTGLDEWAGMNGDDEGSCRFHLNNQLFDPLSIVEEKICFFDGREDLNAECERIEDFILQHGGIHTIILGLGMNGHVGMNEPGTSPALRSHITDIDAQTQKVGQKYFKEKQQLTKGITLGLTTILEARNIILLISGHHKARIAQQVLEDKISGALPASLLRNHPGLKVYLDKEAATFLQLK